MQGWTRTNINPPHFRGTAPLTHRGTLHQITSILYDYFQAEIKWN